MVGKVEGGRSLSASYAVLRKRKEGEKDGMKWEMRNL